MSQYQRVLVCISCSLFSFALAFSLLALQGDSDDSFFLLIILMAAAAVFVFYGLTGALLWIIVLDVISGWKAGSLTKNFLAACLSTILVIPYPWILLALISGGESTPISTKSIEVYLLAFPVSMLGLFYYWLFFIRKEVAFNKANHGDR